MKIQLTTHHKCQLKCPPCIRSIMKPSRDIMSMETYYNIMDILPQLENVDLTPINGDPLLDPFLIERMDHLENSEKIEHFDFVTNLLSLNDSILKKLLSYNKFSMFISIYGDDYDSFKVNTNSFLAFNKFKSKFQFMYNTFLSYQKSIPITFYFRDKKYEDIPDDNWLKKYIRNLMLAFKNINYDNSHAGINYNWGGQHINVENPVPIPEQVSPCLHLLEQNCIFPNGDVTACGLVDVNKQMLLGNILSEGMQVFNKPKTCTLCNGCNEYEQI